jgi:Peptidase family M28
MKISSVLVLLACFHVETFLAQVNDDVRLQAAKTIQASELREHLQILASDEYEGRETGSKGQRMAAQYITEYYQKLGLAPGNKGSYAQDFPLKRQNFLKSTIACNGRTYNYVKDFFTWGAEWEVLQDNSFIFVGYGIDEEKYSDLKNVNIKDKIVICLSGEPRNEAGQSLITGAQNSSDWAVDIEKKQAALKARGAKGLMVIEPGYEVLIQRIRYWLEQPGMDLDYPTKRQQEDIVLPTVYVSREMGEQLLALCKTSIDKEVSKISKRGKSKCKKIKKAIDIKMVKEMDKLSSSNVLAFLEGSDPVLKNEIVVISAHYDHIGIVKNEINNGADDDGSGTVTTLELAEAFKYAVDNGKGPKRSILFLHVSGEEKGLLGSEWYSEYPVYPLENTVVDLNIDMIGRKDDAHADGKYVYIIGSDKLSTDLHKISEQCNKDFTKIDLDYTYNDPNDPNRFYYRSDHYNFAKHNIPVIFYFSGVHEDYHKPGDDTEKIMFDKMTTIGELIFHTAWDVANRPEKLKVDVVSDFKNE